MSSSKARRGIILFWARRLLRAFGSIRHLAAIYAELTNHGDDADPGCGSLLDLEDSLGREGADDPTARTPFIDREFEPLRDTPLIASLDTDGDGTDELLSVQEAATDEERKITTPTRILSL